MQKRAAPASRFPFRLPNLLLKVLGVNLGKVHPFFRDVGIGKDCLDRTCRYARAAIDTDFRIDIQLFVFVLSMDAVNRAHVDARFVFCAYAGFSNNVCHVEPCYWKKKRPGPPPGILSNF